MVSAYAEHPRVSDIVEVNELAAKRASTETADLFLKLILVCCVKEAKEAIKYEGDYAMETSFQVLSKVVAMELIGGPTVNQKITEFTEYLDTDAFNKLYE